MNPGRLEEIKDYYRAERAQGISTPKTVTELIDAVEELLGCFAIEQHAEAVRNEKKVAAAQELADEWGSFDFPEDCGNWYATQLNDALKDEA